MMTSLDDRMTRMIKERRLTDKDLGGVGSYRIMIHTIGLDDRECMTIDRKDKVWIASKIDEAEAISVSA